MGILKKQYNALTDKEKNNFKEVVSEGVRTIVKQIPLVGEGVDFATTLIEWERHKKERIIPKMMQLAEPSELSDVEKEFMKRALYEVLSDQNTVISEYVMKKKDELSALIVKNYEKYPIEGNASEKVKNFAEKIVFVMQENIYSIEKIETTNKKLLETVAEHDDKIKSHDMQLKEHKDILADHGRQLEILTNEQEKAAPFKDFAGRYRDIYDEPLCIHKGEPVNRIRLRDVFVMPDAETDGVTQSLDDTVKSFIDSSANEAMLLLAHGGFGKTSFVAHMAANKEEFCGERPLHIIRLREYSNVSINELCENIANRDARENIAKDAVIVFDGLDELCMIKGKEGSSHEDKSDQIIRDLVKEFYAYLGNSQRKIIITSRPGFICVNNGKEENIKIFLGMKTIEVIKAEILPFDLNKRSQFVEKMQKADPRLKSDEKKAGCDYVLNLTDFEIATDIATSPFILYLICCVQLNNTVEVDVSKLSNTWYLFRKIFHDLYMMNYYRDDRNDIEKELLDNREKYYKKTCGYAFEMYRKGLGSDDLIHISDNKEDMKELEDCYALSCYFNRRESGVIEFSHNYIRDFFVCEYILNELDKLIGDSGQIDMEKGARIAEWCSENLLYWDMEFDTQGDDPIILSCVSDYFDSKENTYRNFSAVNNDNIHFIFDYFANINIISVKALKNTEKYEVKCSQSIDVYEENVIYNTQAIFQYYFMKIFPNLSVRWLTQSAPNVMIKALNLWCSDMSEVDLGRYNLEGRHYYNNTRFKDTYDPQAHGMVYRINESDLEEKLGNVIPFIRRQMRIFIVAEDDYDYTGYNIREGDHVMNCTKKYDPIQNKVIESNSICTTPADMDTVIVIPTLRKGEIIRFGNYEWYILKNNAAERKLLLMAVSRVADLPLHDKMERIEWHDCSLRKWLNEEFIKEFSETERKRIVETKNDDYGVVSKDKFFILSKAEYDEYMELRDVPMPDLTSRTISPENMVYQVGCSSTADDSCLYITMERYIYPALWLSY